MINDIGLVVACCNSMIQDELKENEKQLTGTTETCPIDKKSDGIKFQV